MQRLRAAFVVTIVDPIHEAWFRELATDRTIDFRVFALRDKLSHRPGWQTRHDAGFGVEIGGMNARAHEAEWTGLSIVPP